MTGRIDPWRAELPENYARLMEEFGISSFEEILPDIPDPMPIMRRRIILATGISGEFWRGCWAVRTSP